MKDEEIVEKIRVGLRELAEKNKINYKHIRIKISEVSRKIKLEVLLNTEKIEDVELKSFFKLNLLTNILVSEFLQKQIKKYSQELGVVTDIINLRIYTTKEDYSPSLYLFVGGKAVRPVPVDELRL